MKSQGIANRTQMAPTGALKQHTEKIMKYLMKILKSTGVSADP